MDTSPTPFRGSTRKKREYRQQAFQAYLGEHHSYSFLFPLLFLFLFSFLFPFAQSMLHPIICRHSCLHSHVDCRQTMACLSVCLSLCLCFHSTTVLPSRSSPIHSRGWGCLLALPPPDVPLHAIYSAGQAGRGGANVYSANTWGIPGVHGITTKPLPFPRPPGPAPACHVSGTRPRSRRTVFHGSRIPWSCPAGQGVTEGRVVVERDSAFGALDIAST